MNHDSLKKHSNRFVRIRPALQRYDATARLETTLEDSWWLTDVTPQGVRLQNQPTGHTRILGLDHIHHYVDDPHGVQTGGPTGILVLNVQLLLFNGELLIEPIGPPGSPLKNFVPAQKREDFLSAAKRRQADAKLAAEKREFVNSLAGIKASDEAFYGILEGIDAIEVALREQGNAIDITRKKFGFKIVFGAFGWWVSVDWERYANTLENSRLTLRKWDGHPPFPGVMSIRKPNCVTIEHYTFGLVSSTQAEWIRLDNEQHHIGSAQLVKNVLYDFMSEPLDPVAQWFE